MLSSTLRVPLPPDPCNPRVLCLLQLSTQVNRNVTTGFKCDWVSSKAIWSRHNLVAVKPLRRSPSGPSVSAVPEFPKQPYKVQACITRPFLFGNPATAHTVAVLSGICCNCNELSVCFSLCTRLRHPIRNMWLCVSIFLAYFNRFQIGMINSFGKIQCYLLNPSGSTYSCMQVKKLETVEG